MLSNIMSLSPQEIEREIHTANLTVGIIGLGRMGLPLACIFVEMGAHVIGADIDVRLVEMLQKGQCPIDEPHLQRIIEKHIGERFIVTTNVPQVVSQSDIILIIVPTSVDNFGNPDYSALEKACKEIGLTMKRGCLIMVASTVGTGITELIVQRILERNSGLTAGNDFGLAYSPLRAMAGSVVKDLQTYPLVIGGYDETSLNAASAVLTHISNGGIIRMKDLKTAETTKLFENVYRDVNIALASELAIFCEKAGLDFVEIREAAMTQPYCHLHVPRVGVGGHCIPYNPYFLITQAESLNVDLKLVKHARKINNDMPLHIVHLVAKGLKTCKRSFKSSKIAVLGISYRSNVKEAKNSPALKIIEMLRKRGASVNVYDPLFSTIEIENMGFHAVDSIEAAVRGVDCVLLATGHEQFKKIMLADISRTARKPACVVDGWRIFNAEEAKKNNLVYYGVGLG